MQPLIDRKEEEFGTVPMYKVSQIYVNPTASTKRWTLVYMTEYADDNALKNNPVSCYCFPSSDTLISTTSVGDVTYDSVTLPSAHRYYMSAGMNSGDSFTITKIDGTSATYTVGTNCASVLFYPSTYTNGSGTVTAILLFRIWSNTSDTSYKDYNCSKAVFSSCKQV